MEHIRFDDFKNLLKKDRSIRRFIESKELKEEQLESLVDLTRYCSSGRNLQPLKYKIISDADIREKVFGLLAWAGYLKDWAGPEKGERPTGYLVQCLDTRLTSNCLCDDGLQLQAITLGATSMGLGCCIIKAFNVTKLIETLNLPDYLIPLYVVALGYPAETVKIIDVTGNDADIKYYRDEKGTHYVPKRILNDLIIK